MYDCIFCKIAAGELPCTKVYEDDAVLAFEDLNPHMPVHTLVIPKEHYANLADEVPEELLGHLLAVAKKVTKMKGINESGFRIISNSGKHAFQTVPHLHLHVLGGGQMNTGNPAV
ncbi:MAG: histidine triad nucleotide-binding protein [Eggerthellaceae bacterium]|nr:histidine triad nucleotide-binding protein [Eggerthellaceae bacterium]